MTDNESRARLLLSAHAALLVLHYTDRPDMWLSMEARRDLKRMTKELEE